MTGISFVIPELEKKFCTYLTVYSGNKLPPFYIGHTLSVAHLNRLVAT